MVHALVVLVLPISGTAAILGLILIAVSVRRVVQRAPGGGESAPLSVPQRAVARY